jgi:hypothetical protein
MPAVIPIDRAGEMLTRRDGDGSELIAQSWDAKWAAAMARSTRGAYTQLNNSEGRFDRFILICVNE